MLKIVEVSRKKRKFLADFTPATKKAKVPFWTSFRVLNISIFFNPLLYFLIKLLISFLDS